MAVRNSRKIQASTDSGALRLGLLLLAIASVAIIVGLSRPRTRVIVKGDPTNENIAHRREMLAGDSEGQGGPIDAGDSGNSGGNAMMFSQENRDDAAPTTSQGTQEDSEWHAAATSGGVNRFTGLGEGMDAFEKRLEEFGDAELNKNVYNASAATGQLKPILTNQAIYKATTLTTGQALPQLFGMAGVSTGCYELYSQKNAEVTADIAFRLEAMNRRYCAIFADVQKPPTIPLRVFVFTDSSAMTNAGGHPTMPGAFLYTNDNIGPRLLVRSSGATDIPFWELLTHEGWHQFCSLEVSTVMPLWLDEGMAMYLGYGIFTGDGTVEGTIRPAVYYSLLESAPQFEPLSEFFKIDSPEWYRRTGNGTVWASYMQGWSLVHFLRHADNGRHSKLLDAYIADVVAGRDTASTQRKIVALESRYKRWINGLTFSDEHTKFYEALAGILTSHLARAHAEGQRFDNGDEFLQAFRDGKLKMPPMGDANWLPPSLRSSGLWYLTQMEAAYGACDVEIDYRNGNPSLRLTHKSAGIDLRGVFKLKRDGEVESVDVTWLRTPPDDLEDAYLGG